MSNKKAKIYLIDPKLSFKDKFKFFNYFIVRAFLIAVFLVFIIFVLFLFIYFGDLLVNVRSGKYKKPLYSAYIIVSKSMIPTIQVQDGIFVKRNNNLKIGDIITYTAVDPELSDINITHRIVGKEKLESGRIAYRTKGDNNTGTDKFLVPFDNIYGRVMAIFPKLGYLRMLILNPIGFIVVILIPIGLIILINKDTKKIKSYW